MHASDQLNRPVRFDMTSSHFPATGQSVSQSAQLHHHRQLISSDQSIIPPSIHPLGSTPNPTMLRSRLSPLLLSTPTKSLFRQSPHRLTLPKSLSTAPKQLAPKLSLIIRPPPSKNALQLARVFSTTAVSKDVKATIVSSN
jgi:hypothetical protein